MGVGIVVNADARKRPTDGLKELPGPSTSATMCALPPETRVYRCLGALNRSTSSQPTAISGPAVQETGAALLKVRTWKMFLGVLLAGLMSPKVSSHIAPR